MGDIRTAIEAHAQLLQLDGPHRDWVGLGLNIAQERGISHEEFLRTSLAKFPYSVALLEPYATLLIGQGRYQEAYPIAAELDSLGSLVGTEYLAKLYVGVGQYQEAVHMWQSVLEKMPDHPYAGEELTKLQQLIGPPK